MSLFNVKAHQSQSAHWDSVRGLSILFIAFVHTEMLLGWRPFGVDFVTLSYPSIEPIIFLSGFLISQRAFQLSSSNQFKLSTQMTNYVLRRVLRTWPLYYAVIALCFVFPSIVESKITSSLISFLTFTMNFDLYPSGMSHIWSLCVEEICYFLFLFVIPFIRWRFVGLVLWTLCLLPLVGRAYISLTNPPFDLMTYLNRFWYPTFWHWDAFWYGCIVGLIYYKRNLRSILPKTKMMFLGFAFAITALYLFLNLHFQEDFKVFGQITNPLWGVAISICLVLGIEAIPGTWLRRSGIVWVGEMSYTLYLIHKLVIHNAADLNRRYDLVFAKGYLELGLCFIAMLVVGYAVFFLCERPLLTLLRSHFSLKPSEVSEVPKG